jgi:zinc transport system substrate-binding protein
MKNILFSVLVVMAIASCNNTQTKEKDAKETDKLKVFAVNYPLYYFAERIGGAHLDLIYPIPNDVDPAYWVPGQSLADIQSCDLILANGADYAKWMAKVSLPSSKVVNTSEADTSKYIRTEQGTTHSHGGSGEHVHADYAFTTWLDFNIAIDQAEAIKNALVKKRPEYADDYSANFEALKSELIDFDKAMIEIGANFQGQTLFASHPVYQYLAVAYGLNIISEHWEPGEMPSDEQWINFKSNLIEHPSNIMLWEGQPSEEVTSSLQELGVTSVLFNPCGNKPFEGDFLSVMHDNINRLKP